ncbi:MAG: hypothetical protein QM582_03285 [Micropruina sp.]|uniref:hypothetical protein n=1 Tax=Micropruina sp. TaxID=2737536 RepID=UPI0039E3C66E
MTDLEGLLREDLRDAADTMPTDLDIDNLLQQGRRRRTARMQRRGLAAFAAAAAVSLVTWVGLSQHTTIGVPDPASSPTAPAPVRSAKFDFEPGVVPRAPYASITAAESDGVLTLTGKKRASDPGVTLASVPLNTTTVTGTPISPRLSLWTIPGQVDWVNVVTNLTSDISASYGNRTGYLSSVGVTVVLGVSHQDQDSKDWVEGLIWRSADGNLHSSAGTTVSTAALRVGDRTQVVYRDPGLKQISFFDPLNGPGFAATRDTPARNVVKLSVWRNSTTRGWEQFTVGILPAGAHDPKVATAIKGAEVTTGVLQPDGAVVFFAYSRADAEPKGSFITKVTYTDADGQVRTYRP